MEQEIQKSKPEDLIAPENFEAHWKPDMTDEEYHADKTAIGSSSLRAAVRSLKEFHWDMFSGKSKPETKDMILGKKIHLAILEPEKFKSLYVVEPVFEGYTKKGELTTDPKCSEVKEKKAAWYADLGKDAVVVTEDELEMITGIAQSIMEHPDAKELIEGARPEVAGYYRDPETGLRMKIKPDLMFIGDVAVITDLKSTINGDRFRFGAKTFSDDLRYDIQLFQYAEGTRIISGREVPQVHVISAEKKKCREVSVYYFEREDLGKAEQDYRNGLRRIRHAIDEGVWPQRQMWMERIHTPKFFEANSVEQDELDLENEGVGNESAS